MKKISAVIIFCLYLGVVFAQNKVSHDIWTELLQKHVSPYGKVDYKGFQGDEKRLDEYIAVLKQNVATVYWKTDEQMAYWINAYNAFTVKLILMNYPLTTIMEIKEDGKDAWHIPFINLGDKTNYHNAKYRRALTDH